MVVGCCEGNWGGCCCCCCCWGNWRVGCWNKLLDVVVVIDGIVFAKVVVIEWLPLLINDEVVLK